MRRFFKEGNDWKCILGIILAGTSAALFGIPIGFNKLFEIKAPFSCMVAHWEISDALNYTAGILTFVGTMFLGWVSWGQNRQLQRIESNSFIAQNACMVLLGGISFIDFGRRAINLDTAYEEPIVVETKLEGNDHSSFAINIKLKRLDNYAALVRVESAAILVGEEHISATVFAKAYDDKYSRLAISEDNDAFKLVVILRSDTKEKILLALQENSKIIIEIGVELVTANYVWTKLKCRSSFFKKDTSKKLRDGFCLEGTGQQCFWIGNGILDPKSVKLREMKE